MRMAFKLAGDLSLVIHPEDGPGTLHSQPDGYIGMALIEHHLPRFVYDTPLALGDAPPVKLEDGKNGTLVPQQDKTLARFYLKPSQMRAIASAMLSAATEART